MELIIAAVLAAIPTAFSVGGVFVAVGKFVKSLAELKTEVTKTKQFDELKDELKIAHRENRELKKQINELLTKIDRIDRKE